MSISCEVCTYWPSGRSFPRARHTPENPKAFSKFRYRDPASTILSNTFTAASILANTPARHICPAVDSNEEPPIRSRRSIRTKQASLCFMRDYESSPEACTNNHTARPCESSTSPVMSVALVQNFVGVTLQGKEFSCRNALVRSSGPSYCKSWFLSRFSWCALRRTWYRMPLDMIGSCCSLSNKAPKTPSISDVFYARH